MSKDCQITFDQNEHGTYFTGQVVTGKVIVNFTKTKKLRGIKLQINGYACAQWRVKRGNVVATSQASFKPGRKHHCTGREDYISSTTYLMGSAQGQMFSIDPGTYTYSFACPIPSHCPSSFEGIYGHIRYLAKVTLIRAGASNRTTNVGFTVLKLLDLNLENKILREPASSEAMEYFCLLHSHPVNIKVTLQQQGYVPGQFMLIHADVTNDSNSDCKKLKIMLFLRATYTADLPALRTASEKIMLAKRESGPVQHHSRKSYTESLRIPATAPTCEHLSKVVRVSYEVRIVAVMNWLIANPKVVIPITIGNVPLVTVSSATSPVCAPHPSELPCTSARALELSAGVGNPAFESTEDLADYELPEDGDDEFDTNDLVPEMPPPTYEQAMFMTTDIADTDTNTVSEASHFTPRYPVFDVDTFQTPPPNPPQKKRRRRRRRAEQSIDKKQAQRDEENREETREPVESPIQI